MVDVNRIRNKPYHITSLNTRMLHSKTSSTCRNVFKNRLQQCCATILAKMMCIVSCTSYYTAISTFNTVPRSPFSMLQVIKYLLTLSQYPFAFISSCSTLDRERGGPSNFWLIYDKTRSNLNARTLSTIIFARIVAVHIVQGCQQYLTTLIHSTL